MVYVTRIEHFNAAHKLWNPEWSSERNKEVFGKCANENWHGHNYVLHVTVKGEINAETGFVFNAKALGEIINSKIIDKLDHKNINLDVDFMQGKMTSAEVLAQEIWNQLVPIITDEGVLLHSVKLIETERIFVEYFG